MQPMKTKFIEPSTLSIPFIPATCVAIRFESTYLSYEAKWCELYMSSSMPGMRNCSLVQCDVINNPRSGGG